jgi:N-acetylglucosaminyldiphosphoundecaprenol N-acetyl-beta-D-mannosaminyltransferase
MSKQVDFDKLAILGIDIDALTGDEAIDYICNRAAGQEPACYVVKPYVEFLDRAYRSSEIRQLLDQAELTLADGVALTWAATYLYAGPRSAGRFWLTLSQIILAPDKLRWPLPDRLAGINFTWPLLETARDANLRVYLIGKTTDTEIEDVSARIQKRVTGVTIAGVRCGRDPNSHYGSVSEAWLEHTAAAIREARADLILVGMGFPLQEKVCAYLASHLDHGVFIGEGGTFDYESFGGSRRKAPRALQQMGLEWVWRLFLEPKRLIRQLAIPRFIWRVWRSR